MPDFLHSSIPLAIAALATACLAFSAYSARAVNTGRLERSPAVLLLRVVLPGLAWPLAVYAIFFLPVIDIYLPTQKAPPRYDFLADDKLEDKKPAFIAGLIDSRPFEGYAVNASAAVVSLDVLADDYADQGYATLYPSYAAAGKAWAKGSRRLLASVNAVDGKAKQFDDGLLAALHEAYAEGGLGPALDLRAFLEALRSRLDARGPAAAWIAAGLSGGAPGEPPQGFYAWSPRLCAAWRLIRYFMRSLPAGSPVAVELVGALARGAALRSRYEALVRWASRLDSEGSTPSLLALLSGPARPASLIPASRSKEDLLLERAFSRGIPPDADLTLALVQAIRSGKVDLKPGKDAGWFDYEVYALETLLLPERGDEYKKLLLKKRYKKRMLKAFASILAKRRETHALRDLMELGALASDLEGGPPPKMPLAPRLRVEPSPTYFLRMARSYAFLQAYLRSTLPPARLEALHGLKEGGVRTPALDAELEEIRQLFYGLHIVSCEDLGMKTSLLPGEVASPARAASAAEKWLSAWTEDPDLSVDARVIVPVAFDSARGVTRHMGALGVRAAILTAGYARAPKWRPVKSKDDAAWSDASTTDASWVILVDEPAEVESKRPAFSREELRRVADRERTKEKILAALR